MASRKSGKTSEISEESPFVFGYEEFAAWYRLLESSCLEPARLTFLRLLNQKLDDELSEFDRNRIRVTASRVKSPGRTWQKLKKDKYRDKVKSLDSIPGIIDDLVGVRITCNNLVDITYLQSILSDLPSADGGDDTDAAFSIEPDSEKQYYSMPKPSGYRAYHINLVTLIPQVSSKTLRTRGELQVRTLLQDGWGELTHEDTYKPGVPLPQLVRTLSRRMADLLATVDDLAQDLREELDRLAVEAVGTNGQTPTDPQVAPPPDHQHLGEPPLPSSNQQGQPLDLQLQLFAPPRQALLTETRRVVNVLKRPATLASVAQQIQAVFGTGIVPDWGGYGSFKSLLLAAVPEVDIVGVGPGIIVPPGSQPPLQNEIADLNVDPAVPEVLRNLRRYDKNVPAVSDQDLSHIVQATAIALEAETWEKLELNYRDFGIRELNILSRYSRDEVQSKLGAHVSHPQLDYVLKALLWSGNLRSGLPIKNVKDVLARWLIARASKFGLVSSYEDDANAIIKWLDSAHG